MPTETHSLFAALLLSAFTNTLLATQTGYWARPGLLLAPLSAAVLACTGWMFARCWPANAPRLARGAFAALLMVSSVLELLRLWHLADVLYPGEVTLAAVCFAALLPVIYLRRLSAIAQTANVLLCLLLGATAVMLVSVMPHLRIQNLQAQALAAADWADVLWAQWTLYPEFLLPALWPEHRKRGAHTLFALAAATLAFDAGLHVVLELFFGAAMPGRQNPLHTAAQSGALSVFNRLEWLQLLLWTMAVSLKLALYLYAVIRLCGGCSKGENTAVGLDRYPLYFGGMLLLCALLRRWDVQQALQWRDAFAWVFAGLVGLGGGVRCLWKAKHSG